MQRTAGILMVLIGLAAGCGREETITLPGVDESPASGGQTQQQQTSPSDQTAAASPVATGWLHWRGPSQNGTSGETGLVGQWKLGGENDLWSIELRGRGTPVIARYADGDRVFVWGYRDDGGDLEEVLACLDPKTGDTMWEHTFADFVSDIIYERYSIGSPTVDAETGHVYLMTTPGLLMGFDRDGQMLWERSMMEEFGRLTFPNGRTGAPSVEGDLVIVNAISTNWGREGPARNRFYAFDKLTGDLVWSSTPGVGPPYLRDSSFCSPVFEWRDGRRLFYVGTGCGNVVCVNALTGRPLWRYQMAAGGVNSSVLVYEDSIIAIHGKENVDDTGRGRMVALKAGAVPHAGARGPVVLDQQAELWRNDEVRMFTSSPVLVGDRVYQTTMEGELVCVDATSGETIWHEKLGADQLHASPLYADGKLYVPMWHDGLYIIEPGDDGGTVLDHIELEGGSLGSPSVWNGQIYVHTTKKLYCFGSAGGTERLEYTDDGGAVPTEGARAGASAAKLQVVPGEVLLSPGEQVSFRVRQQTADGLVPAGASGESAAVAGAEVSWAAYIPPTAKVKARLDATFDDQGRLVAGEDAAISAGAFEATWGEPALKGYIRGRVLRSPPYAEDFEGFELTATRKDGTPFAYPPLPWIGARLKWEVRALDGNNVLTKTLDRWLFQRSIVFIGHSRDHGYTMTADVMSDGNRRAMSDVGLINQRYIITLRGNGQKLEVNSNIERLAEATSFSWRPGQWYRLKTQVDVAADGSGVVRGKAWGRDDVEPDGWTIEVPVKRAHTNGPPGIFGFSPNIKFAVYVDNIDVAVNED